MSNKSKRWFIRLKRRNHLAWERRKRNKEGLEKKKQEGRKKRVRKGRIIGMKAN